MDADPPAQGVKFARRMTVGTAGMAEWIGVCERVLKATRRRYFCRWALQPCKLVRPSGQAAQAADKLEDRLVRPLKQFAAPGRRQS